MKTFYKIIAIAFAAASVFASCSKDNTPYEPGKPAGDKDVYFSTENPSTQVLNLSDTEFTVFIERNNASAAESIPLTAWCDVPGIVTVPASVDFAAGQEVAEIVIKLGEMEPFKEYQMNISIPEEYTQPYKEDAGSPQCGFVFYKEDYKTWKTGLLYDDFWSGETWEAKIEYSEMLDQYRLSDWFYPGINYVFKWDGDQKFSGAKQSTGLVDSTYGAVSAQISAGDTFYDKDENVIYFGFTWTVSAGSFGVYYNVFYID